MRRLWLAPLWLTLLLIGCSTPVSPAEVDPCDAVSCGDNGHCASHGDVAECVCNTGYVAQGLSCVPGSTGSSANPCDGVSCGNGHCAVHGTAAECVCDTGYVAQGLSCVAGPEACASNPCGATGKQCTAQSGVAVCACPSGFVDQGNGCVRLSACAVNPCTGTNRNVCFEVEGQASCLCNPGYELVGGSCAPIATGGGACGAHPATSTDDTFEPDECASSSSLYSAAQTHTLSPGDVDWVHFSVTAGHIMDVTLSGSSVPLYVDLFGADGTTALAAEHSGSSTPSLKFVADTTGIVFLRVKGAIAGDSGGYTLTVTDKGADDYPGSAASAQTVVVGNTLRGTLQFEGDEDFMKLPVEAGRSYRFSLASSTPTGIAIEIYEADGKTLRKTLDTTLSANMTHTARPRTAGAYVLRARAAVPGTTGSFSFTVADLGVDDHGDVVQDADTVAVTSSAVPSTFNRSDDVDVFTFPVVANHTYRFTCTYSSWPCLGAMRDANGVVIAQQTDYSSSSSVVFVGQATAAGTWNVSVYPYASSGAYTYQLEDIAGDDYSNSYQTPFVIQLGTPVNGSLELSTDRDVFGVSTVAGHVYRVTCGSPVTGLCSFTVRNPNGNSVATGSSNQDTAFLSAGGQYTIDVGTYNAKGGLYTVTVTDDGTDDYGNTFTQATPVSLGTQKSGRINYEGDADVFSFPTTAGHIYQVKCATGPFTCALWLYDSSGTRLGSNYNPSTTAVGVLADGGTYSVSIAASYGVPIGDYTFTVTDVGTDDQPNSTAGAQALTLGTAVSGNVQYIDDADVFTFAGTAQHIYRAVCTGPSTLLCQLVIRDTSGTTVASQFSNSTTNTLYFKAASSQTYSVTVSGFDGSFYGAYQLTVVDDGLDDFGDSSASATAYTVGTPTNGRIQYPGDVDVLAFTSTANHIYRLTCSSSSSYLCTISVKDASGTAVGTSSGTSGNRTIQFYAATAQRYTLQLSASLSGAVGDYAFQVIDDGPDDYPNSAATAPLLAPGTLTGELQYSGDRDFIRFNVTAGKVYNFASPQGQYYYAYLRDPNGNQVGVYASSFGFAAKSSGTYSLETSQAVLGAATGSWSWVLTEGTDNEPDTYSGAALLTLGTVQNASFDYVGDVDCFAVSLTAGTAYTVTTTGVSTTIAVYQADGTTQVGSASANTKTFTPTASGTYYLRLTGSSSTGAYTVKVQ